MTQTGRGCLSRKDLEALRTGYFVIVDIGEQSQQRQILVNDPTKLQDVHLEFGARERILFYLATSAVNNYSRKHGIDVVFLSSPKGLAHQERYSELVTRVYASIPVRLKSMTAVPIPVVEGMESLVEYFSFMVIRSYQTAFAKDNTQTPIQSSNSTEQALQRLSSYGIDRQHLPLKIGGTTNFDLQFTDWIRMRLSIEDVMSAALPTRNLLPDSSAMTKSDRTEKGLSRIIRQTAGATGSNTMVKEDFVKMRNAMYSRRRAHKIKTQVIVLQDEKDTLESEHAELKKENKRLSDLLEQAKTVISNTSHDANYKKRAPSPKVQSNPARLAAACQPPGTNDKVQFQLPIRHQGGGIAPLSLDTFPPPVNHPALQRHSWEPAPLVTASLGKTCQPAAPRAATINSLIVPSSTSHLEEHSSQVQHVAAIGGPENDEDMWDPGELEDLATMDDDVDEIVLLLLPS